MKKQDKQNLLTMIIIILVIVLSMLILSIVYEEKINISKQETQDIVAPTIQEKDKNTTTENEETQVKDEEEEIDENEEYIGEEEQENTTEETIKSKDERAIQLAQQEWGDDNSVTFSVENKKGTKYYIAVKSDATVISWYEVDTENWEISEY